MLIEPIPCLTDNYAYIVYDDISKITSVIDPSEAKPIISFLKEKKIKLNYILLFFLGLKPSNMDRTHLTGKIM